MNEQHQQPARFTRHVLVAIALVTLALFLWKIAPVFMLAFAGIVFASALRAGAEPLARRLHLSETAAVAIVSILVLAALVGGGYAFGAQISSQTQELWSAILQAADKVQEYVSRSPMGASAVESVKETTSGDAMAKVAKGTFTVFGAVGDLVLVIFLAVYLAADPATYRHGALLLLPPAARERVGHALDAAAVSLRKWLVGQLAAMVAVGVLTGLGLWAVGVPLALPLGILSGLLDFVPVIGPLLAAIPGLLIAFSQAPDMAVYAGLVYLAVQFVEGNILLPMAQKWAVSLPPALSLLGIVAFGSLFGPMGVLFAMPLLVVTIVLVRKLYVERMPAGGDGPTTHPHTP